jgi:hypothetical protein
MPILIPPGGAPATGLLKYEWVDPQGIVRDLSQATSPNLFVSKGTTGLGMPPVDIVSDKLPFTAGDIPRHAQTQGREIDLPLYVHGSTIGGLIDTADDLAEWFATADESTRTPGYFRVTRPNDDAVRQIACYYRGGLEGDMGTGSPNTALLVVSLYAPDPYWTDVDEQEVVFGPAHIGIVQGVVNTGDVHAYPIWTIQGPASGISIVNTTTGKSLGLTANGGVTLTAGQSLTIDSRPASQRTTLQIIDQDGVSYYNRVVVGTAPWWVKSGANNFTISATGTSGATAFVLTWLPRYRSALR